MAPNPQRAWLTMRAAGAFVRANVRYWSGIASVARGELRRWRNRAELIEDDGLRELALAKLRDEGFNAQAAAVLATGVRRRELRPGVARALVALTVLYDFLDGVTESAQLMHGDDPLGAGLDASRALSEAVTLSATPAGKYYRRWAERGDDGGYLQELVDAVRRELARLPAGAASAPVLHGGALRCAEAQVRAHAAESLGSGQAIEWAAAEAAASGMQPRDFLAGAASSVLALNAVIAGCAEDGFTIEQGVALDRLYLLISVLPTLLDSVVDRVGDRDHDGFLRYYEDQSAVAASVATLIDELLAQAQFTPDSGQHLTIAAGIVGYYTSHQGAHSDFALPVVQAAKRGLWPLASGALAVVRAWRWARMMRGLARSDT